MRAKHLLGLLAAFLVVDCHSRTRQEPLPDSVSDRSRDPGSTAVPTSELSFALIEDPVGRRNWFANTLRNGGNECRVVIEAALKGGFEGRDFWRVRCSDTGDWLVTVSETAPANPVNCTADPADCRVAWQSVSLNEDI